MWHLGHDIVEIARIQKAMQRHPKAFIVRIFTPKEREYCNRYGKKAVIHYAGRFAAKEAVVKALGTGFSRGISWHDIEILSNAQGKPVVHLPTKLQEMFPNREIEISISHTNTIASAVAICS